MKNSSQEINDPELNLVGKIYGLAPIQAEGTIDGHSFYFWAKRDAWSFAISETIEIKPVDIQNTQSGQKYGFYKASDYGIKGSQSASWMDTDQVEKIIIDCCKAYKETKIS